MGKFRLKLQAMMPSVWYRKLKMELGMRAGASHHTGPINYKRWSSQRKQLGSSKKLLKASPLPSTPSPITASFAQLQERESHTISLPSKERECASHAPTTTASIEQTEIHFTNSAAAIAQQVQGVQSHTAEMQLIEEKEPANARSLGKEDSHPEAPLSIINTQFPQQAPSLSSPLPLSDKSFQLNLQELNSKLKALDYDKRRTYYSSPIFATATPTPVFDKLDLDITVKNSTETYNESFVARKLFSEDVKLVNNEASRSSYGSTSLTGQSNTSSEDTAFDKASSSSVWEREFSSLPSEGSELIPAVEKIRNTVSFLRRKSRKARKDASMKQRRRQKDVRSKLPHALDEYGHFDCQVNCFDDLCQYRVQEKVPSIEKLKMALAGSRAYALHSLLDDEAPSIQAQSENSFHAKRQEGDDFVRHRRSVSNESLFLETVGVKPAFNRRSPWQHDDAGFDKLSPSDSALSDSELESCRSHRSNVMHERYGSIDELRRQPPKQGFSLGKDTTHSSPLYNEAYPEFLLPAWRQHPANLPRPSSSKSKSSYKGLHSSVCSGKESLSTSMRENFDANSCCSPSFKSRRGYGFGAPCDDRNHIKSLLYESTKSGLNVGSPSARIGSRRAFGGSSYDHQCRSCSKSFNTWGASPESSNRSKVLKGMSNISSDNDDYDGDVSLRSYNEHCMMSLGKSYRRLTKQLEGKECDGAPVFSRNPSTRTTNTSRFQSCVPPLQKSASKQSISDDYESLHGIISVPAWSKIYSKGEGDGKEAGIAAFLSKSPTSFNTLNQDDASEEQMVQNMATQTIDGQQDCKESLQSHSRVTSAWDRSPTSTGDADGKDPCTDSLTSLIEREMGRSGAAVTPKCCSRREELDGLECRVEELKGRDDKERKKGKEGELKEEGENMNESVEKRRVYESFAMVKCSNNPSKDFKESMMEMVLHKKLHESLDLVELLQCYLALNSARYHDIIVKAFIDLWSDLFSSSV